MAGGANGSRVVGSGLILVRFRFPLPIPVGAASLVGWGLFGGRQRAASGKDKCQPTKCATYYYRIYPVLIVIEL